MAACCRLTPATVAAAHGPLIRGSQRVPCTWQASPALALSPRRAAALSNGRQEHRALNKGALRPRRHPRAVPESVGASGDADETPIDVTPTEPAQSSTSTPTPTPPPTPSTTSTTSSSTRFSLPASSSSPAPATSSTTWNTSSSSSSSSSRSSQSGDPASREVLDAFFLGRALAEVVLERVGSAVGEFLSDVGRAQAEQQQQIRQFQDEVQARAEEAQQKAAKQTRGPSS